VKEVILATTSRKKTVQRDEKEISRILDVWGVRLVHVLR
jgi:hypothetical protein